MPARDPRIDAYIESAADFARPILRRLRAFVHAACPAVEETMKWGHPHFMYRGMLCGMAAFKRHCAFGFWKESLLLTEAERKNGAMGQFGRITQLRELPPRPRMRALIRRAMALNDAGTPKPAPARTRPRPPPRAPNDLVRALSSNRAARATFAGLSPSGQREYVEWLADTKREETRARRLATAIEWLSEGKGRNWQYERPRRRAR